jgi:hypothetical protein
MVVGNEAETNTGNNTASASVVVNQLTPPSPPPVFCGPPAPLSGRSVQLFGSRP